MLDGRKVLLYVTRMLAKHTSPTPSRQSPGLASMRREVTALRPGGRGAEVSMEIDESPLAAILCGLCMAVCVLLACGIALMVMPR